MQMEGNKKSVATGCVVAAVVYWGLAVLFLYLLSSWRLNTNGIVLLGSWCVAVFAGGFTAARRASTRSSGRNRALVVGGLAMLVLLPVVLGYDILFPDIIPYVYWAYLTALVLSIPIACLGATAAQRTGQNNQGPTATS